MKTTIVALTVIAITLITPTTTFAEDLTLGDSRPRMAFHGGAEIEEGLMLVTHVLPTPDLKKGLAPLAYLELAWSPLEWIKISPTVGYDFSTEETIFSVRLAPHHGPFWGWFDFEWSTISDFGYTFGMAEVKPLDWFSTGLEYECWGSLLDSSTWSWGGGPDVVFHLGKIDLEMALHFRGVETGTTMEFVTRAHIFLF